MEWKLQNIETRTFKHHTLIGCQQTKFSLGSGLDHQLISSNISYLRKISSCKIIIWLEQDTSFLSRSHRRRAASSSLFIFIFLPLFTEQPQCWLELAAHMHVMPVSSSASSQYTNLSCLFLSFFVACTIPKIDKKIYNLQDVNLANIALLFQCLYLQIILPT